MLIRNLALSLGLSLVITSIASAVPTNLAPSGTASASTANGCYGGVAAAIDGNRDGSSNALIFHTDFPDGNAPSFYQVQLASASFLDHLELYPRTNAIQGSVENFRIEVFNGGGVVFTKDYLTTSNTGDVPWGTSDIRNIFGDTVRLTRLDPLPQNPNFLTFAEFEVYGQAAPIGKNLALTATVSSNTTPGFGSQNIDAIDGDINGHFFRTDTSGLNPVTPVYHTSTTNAGDFIELDLGSNVEFEYINLFSRTDFQQNSPSATLQVLAADGATVVFSQNVNWFTPQLGGQAFRNTFDLTGVEGQFVRVVNNNAGLHLTFAEIEVFGVASVPEPASLVLLALAGGALLRRRKRCGMM